MTDDATRTGSGDPRANSLWETIRRNGNAIVLIGVFIAGLQYQSAMTARTIEQFAEQIGARMTSLENGNATAIAAVQESQRQLAARMRSIEDDVRELRAVMRGVLERLARIEGKLDLRAAEEAPDDAAEAGDE